MSDASENLAAQTSCDVLADLLQSEWSDLRTGMREFWPHETRILRQLMLADLSRHAAMLDYNKKQTLWSELAPKMALAPFVLPASSLTVKLPEVTVSKSLFSRTTKESPSQSNGDGGVPVHHADIIILTILPVERDAVLATFGQDPRRREDFSDKRGNFYYKIPFWSARYDVSMTAWLAMIGAPENVRCAIFVGRLGKLIRFKNIVLLGIAGGNREKVNLGDVVTSTSILDNEGGVDEFSWWVKIFGKFFGRRRHQPRIDLHDHEGISTTLLRNFTPDISGWHNNIRQIVEGGRRGALKFDASDASVAAEYRPGLIQAGDRLKRDGSLPEISRIFHDKLYAVEMEGSGFAQACKGEYEWMVFRGISDYGDPEKRDKKQAVAAIGAATLLKQFLESTFQTNTDESSGGF